MQYTKLDPVKIVLRDPPLPFLVMAIVMKVPMSKTDSAIEDAPIPSDNGRENRPKPNHPKPSHLKPNQWARATSASSVRRAG
jgi:hypothetical protein